MASHRAACEDYQQLSGTEGPQVRSEAQIPSPPEVLQVEHDLKMVQEKRTQWEEPEHLKQGAASVSAALGGGKESLRGSRMVIVAVILWKIRENGT